MSTQTQSNRKLIRNAIILAIAAASIFGFGNSAFLGGAVANTTASDASYEYITISSGQTLWDLAEQVAPDQNPQDWMQDVVNLNGLTSTDLKPGQRIAIP